MARRDEVKLGEIWLDSNRNKYEILGWDGKKFVTMNLKTKHRNAKGPRALVKKARNSPVGTVKAAQCGAPPKRARGRGRNPVELSRTEPTMPLSAIRDAGPMPLQRSGFHGAQRNPSHYPSPLAEYVAQELSRMSPADAGIPSFVLETAGRAVAQWERAQRAAAAGGYRYGG